MYCLPRVFGAVTKEPKELNFTSVRGTIFTFPFFYMSTSRYCSQVSILYYFSF
jgi:hypothetical protein